MDLNNWIPAIISNAMLLTVLYFARDLIKSRIKKGIEHRFNKELEELRATFRKSEESFRADLRVKETEIAALRDRALSGLASRQELLHSRRLKAVERTWSAVVNLRRAKGTAMIMSITKFDSSAREAAKNPRAREMFQLLGKNFKFEDFQKIDASGEQPFVSPLA